MLACVLHHMRKGPSPSGKANVAFPVQSGAIHNNRVFSSIGVYAKIFVKVKKVARVAKVAKVASD